MGRSGAARKKRRALAAMRFDAPRQLNKFVLPPRADNGEPPEAVVANGKDKNHAGNKVSKRKRKAKKSAEKVRRRIEDIALGPGVSEVTIQWENGTRKTFKLPRDEGNGAGVVWKGEKAEEPLAEEQAQVCSACGVRARTVPLDRRRPSIHPEARDAGYTPPYLPADTIGLNSALAIPETQLGGTALPQPMPSRQPSVSLSEVANSQASENSFHNSREYPSLAERRESMCSTRGTRTTSRARRVSLEGSLLDHLPELDQGSREEDVNQEAVHSMSSPPVLEESSPRLPELCLVRDPGSLITSPSFRKLSGLSAADHETSDTSSESSQKQPALHPEPESPPSTHATASKSSPRNKRAYDPYEFIPTPPKRRILRSSGKSFSAPPWESPEPKSTSADAAMAPRRAKSGLLRGKPVVSEAELVSIFSEPDPEFDRFDGGTPKANMATPPTNNGAETRAGTPAPPSNGSLAARKDENAAMPPRNRAIREWMEDKGELSDDTSYSGVMSTPLGNYGRSTRITSNPLPELISVEKRTAAKGTKTRRRSSSGSWRSVSKGAAARIGELPTSSTADSPTGSSRSRASTRPTSPLEESVSKSEPRPQGMALVPGIPSLGRRRASKPAPGTPPFFGGVTFSVAKAATSLQPSPTTGVRGSCAAASSSVHDMPTQASAGCPPKNTRTRIEIPITTINSLAAQTSTSMPSKPQAEEKRGKTKRKKAEGKAETGRKEWVAPEKRTPVPLPPYVAMMQRQ